MEMKPTITKTGLLDIQVCVPADWTDDQVTSFANQSVVCGCEKGWHIRKQGDTLLRGMPERNPCDAVKGYVHVMLDA